MELRNGAAYSETPKAPTPLPNRKWPGNVKKRISKQKHKRLRQLAVSEAQMLASPAARGATTRADGPKIPLAAHPSPDIASRPVPLVPPPPIAALPTALSKPSRLPSPPPFVPDMVAPSLSASAGPGSDGSPYATPQPPTALQPKLSPRRPSPVAIARYEAEEQASDEPLASAHPFAPERSAPTLGSKTSAPTYPSVVQCAAGLPAVSSDMWDRRSALEAASSVAMPGAHPSPEGSPEHTAATILLNLRRSTSRSMP